MNAIGAESLWRWTELGDAGVAAEAIGRRGSDRGEEFAHRGFLPQHRNGQAAGVKVSALSERDHFFRERAHGFGLGEGGADLFVLDQAAHEVREQRAPVARIALQFFDFVPMSHG